MVKRVSPKDLQLRGKLRTAAREMRQKATPAEDLLWQHLRGRQIAGRKFLRQVSIDRFIVDFFCSSAALIVEVDGEIHQMQVEADREREDHLIALGYRVIRFTNEQVLCRIGLVIDEIRNSCL